MSGASALALEPVQVRGGGPVARYLAYRLFPDSAAARGEAPHQPEQPGSLGKAFAHLLAGVHW